MTAKMTPYEQDYQEVVEAQRFLGRPPFPGYRDRPEWAIWDRYSLDKQRAALSELSFVGLDDGFFYYEDQLGSRFRIKTLTRRKHEHDQWLLHDARRRRRVEAQEFHRTDVASMRRQEKEVQRRRFWAGFIGTFSFPGLLLSFSSGGGILGLTLLGSIVTVLLWRSTNKIRAKMKLDTESVDRAYPPTIPWGEPGKRGNRGESDEWMFFSPREVDERNDERDRIPMRGW